MKPRLPRALVVEDEPSWQQILSENLSDAGLQVDTAGSLETAQALSGSGVSSREQRDAITEAMRAVRFTTGFVVDHTR